jgi:hypothetical protein
MNTPTTDYEQRLDEIIVLSLRKAYTYAYEKGQALNKTPDPVAADAIKAELEAAITQLIEEQVVAGRIDQMLIESDSHRKTLDLFRIKNPGTKLPRGLSLGFQTRMSKLKATQSKGGGE